MKNRILLLLISSFILSLVACRNDKLVELCPISPEAEAYFKKDVYFMALKNIYRDSTSLYQSYQDSINVPEELQEEILEQLASIYDNYTGPERDEIIETYHIHTFPLFVDNELIMRLITNKEWVQEFVNGEEIMSNDSIKQRFDEFNIKYNYTLLETNSSKVVSTTVDSMLNLVALSEQLDNWASFDTGILYIDVNAIGSFGFREDITIHQESDTTIFNFRTINGLTWNFGVDDNCTPFFLGN